MEELGQIDFIYVKGEKRYFVRFARTLAKTPAMQRRMGLQVSPVNEYLDPMISEIREKGSMARRITIEAQVGVDDKAFEDGEYEAWLPFPAECAQQSDIVLEAGEPDYISDAHAPARTAHFSKVLETNEPFVMRYSYTSRIVYADPLNQPAPEKPLYPNALPPCADDLAEDGTWIVFTPVLRQLEKQLSEGATTPVEKAWRYYEFITKKVRYSFVRDYFQIDNIGEYCAVNLRGDCGLMAILFINLCRIGGIPARWQSGLDIAKEGPGNHDWTQFWLDGWGWLFCDPSFGGSAWRSGATERHQFYFGNLEPMRMVANRKFMAPLDPPMPGFRVDPYDSQSGEIICLDMADDGDFFNGRQKDDDATLISCVPVD